MPSVQHDQNIIDALEKLPKTVFDKKHNLTIVLNGKNVRSNETRFEHIARKYHQLKVRDIESIVEGINHYVVFTKSRDKDSTYYYYIKRKGTDKGFIQLAIKLYDNDFGKAYVKTIYITYKIKQLFKFLKTLL